MSTRKITVPALAAFLFLAAFSAPPKKKIRVWLIGDSTIAQKEVRAYPETGWGMPFTHFFDSTVTVENRAKNGRSTKSFRAEGLWQPILDGMGEGDYVFIQFGHNDEGKEKVGRYTTPEEFRANLARYVAETRSKKAVAVLLTPVTRRNFDSAGQIRETHPRYTDVVKEVARTENVPLIDLNERSRELLQSFGPEASRWLYLYLEPGEHPNYPEGKKDDTHFSELGARKMAGIVWREVKKMKLELAERFVVPPVKK